MKLRFKILLAIQFPILMLMIMASISEVINSQDIIPKMIDYQQDQGFLLIDDTDQIIANKQQILSKQGILPYQQGKLQQLALKLAQQKPKKFVFAYDYDPIDFQSQENDDIMEAQNQTLISFSVIVGVFLLYIWRKSIVLGLSLEVPIQILIEILESGIQNMERQEFTVQFYENLYNSSEIKSLYKTMIHFVNNIKYSNNKLWEIQTQEAECLIGIAKATEFFKEYQNLTAVGICANNISRIHMKNKRYLEAMNDQELSLMIADQEIEELNQYKMLCIELHQKQQENFIERFKLRITQKFRLLDSGWFQKQLASDKKKGKEKVLSQVHQSMIGNLYKKGESQKFVDNINKSQLWIKRPDDNDDKQFQSNVEQAYENASQSLSPLPLNDPRSQGRFFDNPSQKATEKSHFAAGFSSDGKFLSKGEMDFVIQAKLMDIKKQKRLIKQKHLQRKYQLANILYNYSSKNFNHFNNECVKLMKEVYDEAEKVSISKSRLNLQINILFKQAMCHIRKGKSQLAIQAIERAEDTFNVYKRLSQGQINLPAERKSIVNDYQRNQEVDHYFVDIFLNTPQDIIENKIQTCIAMLGLINGRIQSACQVMINILETPSYYDPQLERYLLKTLKNVFLNQNLPLRAIIDFEEQLQEKDYEIIILVDYSSEMSIEQLTLSHTMCKYILTQLRVQDKIGLYAFNETLHEVFPLQKKEVYRELLVQAINSLLVLPGGRANLMKLLQLTAATLFDLNASKVQKKLSIYVKKDRFNPSPQLKLDVFSMEEEFRNALKLNNSPVMGMQNRSKTHTFMRQKTSNSIFSYKSKAKPTPQQVYPKGDTNDECIDEIIKKQNDASSFFSDEEEYPEDQLFKIDETRIEEDEVDNKKIKFICLFSEGIKRIDHVEYDRLKVILKKKRTHLMIFNIANQNANMLFLRNLSKITDQSLFFTSDEELINFFEVHSQNQISKRQYLEFF